jgi:hypothetical protein
MGKIEITNCRAGVTKVNNIAGGAGKGVNMHNGVVVREDLSMYDTEDKIREYAEKLGLTIPKTVKKLETLHEKVEEYIKTL